MITRSLLLVAGPSGSGKSRLARLSEVAAVSLDEFYHNHDHPNLPVSPVGITDWDDPRSWDLDLAIATLKSLLLKGTADIPRYSISLSQRIGMRRLDCADSRVIVAEGIFAPQTFLAAREAGIPAQAIWLDRSRAANFARRLSRDLREHRKSPRVLVRRGFSLYRAEPMQRSTALEAGFQPVSMRSALTLLRRLSISPES